MFLLLFWSVLHHSRDRTAKFPDTEQEQKNERNVVMATEIRVRLTEHSSYSTGACSKLHASPSLRDYVKEWFVIGSSVSWDVASPSLFGPPK